MNYNNGTTESVDVLMPTDMDGIDDIAEEAHHRRASYTNEIKDESRMNGSRERGDRDERGREDERRNDDRSRDRRHSSREGREGHHSHRSGSPSRGGGGGGAGAGGAMERDDKYDRPRPSGNDRERRRSRSRSPARHGAVRDRRVYVGNLSYDVKWTNLKDFMREIGPVAHADVLLGRDGRSKGCGVVEYQNPEDAQEAIRKLNDVVLMGRPVFVREDRESDTRIGFSGGRGGGSERRDSSSSGSRQVFIGNLPYSVNWKDLKDMFRRVGPVDRADIFMGRDNRSKGSGTVSFDSSQDVPRAICM
ncbi:hypothetical protein BG006_011380 [Podila minutissima]|uniref:RRM domain-containing protein n=1 Tax=Podila minutissima TaxID=64525 RepID=A0A9P5VI02_9FUNG|nr:hypothetical protein BG006_011380 [Podila minutissima]